MTVRILHGDCLDLLRTLPDCSVDSIVTDPPYGLGKAPDALAMLRDWLDTGHHDVKGSGFMGKKWDAFVPQPNVWRECLRVLKPGGHLLAFAGTRTQDLMALGLRIAGFEVRDLIAWVYGSGFPKSLDVSKAIDKAAGHWRGKAGAALGDDELRAFGQHYERTPKGDAVTAAAAAAGWGTALKPALEPITLARKPLAGTVAANVQAHGTGALNIDGCRIEAAGEVITAGLSDPANRRGIVGANWQAPSDKEKNQQAQRESLERANRLGRWPANLIHDGSEEVVALFPAETGGDFGSAARFFYCAKASGADRDIGIAGIAGIAGALSGRNDGSLGSVTMRKNHHPTVKPTDLMRYLVRLVTPKGGTVLDPFAGSGSTGRAADIEGFDAILIEREAEYVSIARQRIHGDAPLFANIEGDAA